METVVNIKMLSNLKRKTSLIVATKSKIRTGLIAQCVLIIMALFMAPIMAETQGTLLQGEYIGGLESSNDNLPAGNVSEDGTPLPDVQVLPVIDESWAENLAKMDPSEMVRVTIFLQDQPQAAVSRQIKQKYATELQSIHQEIRSIKEKYTARRDEHAVTDSVNYSREILAPGSEDRLVLDALNERNEAVSLKIKMDMAAALKRSVKPSQAQIKAAITGMGGEVEFSTISVNAIVARVPAGSIPKIAALPMVARIAEDRLMDMHLNVADEASLVSSIKPGGGLRDNGECGGIYDPAVMDTGTDLAHPALQDNAGRTNFYTWYLVAANADPAFNDANTADDLQGHGTHVQGIVSSQGSSGYTDYLGMADCVEKAVTLKSGWLGTDGDGHMIPSDIYMIVDRALYATEDLRPINTFADDVDGINLSFGGNTSSDETDASRFFDSIVSTYNDLLVTISAGNSGPFNTVFTDPATNYNAITVANVQDFGTADRDDDTIRPSSTRGPTANGRRKPDIAAPGSVIKSANNDWETESDFIDKSGTSMSSPMIQGIAMDLMDAGVIDELNIKALLLNTAQKNEPGINFESNADGWSEAYGWGYVNAWAAYFHRADVRKDSVTPNGVVGDYVLYKGQMRDEGSIGEGRDRATMVWNRHADYNAGSFPTTYYGLSNLNMRLYKESDNFFIDYDTTISDNVHQVRVAPGTLTTDVVVKAYAWSTSFAHGGATEEFALATEESFVKVDLPATFQGIGSWPSELEPNEVGTFEFWLRNDSDIASHINQFELTLPTGWTLVSGPAVFNAGSIAGTGGLSAHVIWQLRAPSTAVGAQNIVSAHSHNSYAEAWGPHNWGMGVTVAVDLTPPTPNPMTWSTEPFEETTSAIRMIATTASDLHGPVEYYFWADPLTGGGGATHSNWITSTSYTDSGLGANHQYRYWVQARDAATSPNVTGWSIYSDEYTAIEASTGVTFGTKTSASIDVRSTNTPSGLTRGSSALIVYNDTTGANSGWKQNNNFWTSPLLATNTQYCFAAQSRNGDAAATSVSPRSCAYTLAIVPSVFSFSSITETSIKVNWKPGDNPTWTQYLVENTTNGSTSGWTTALNWNNTGLECGTSYRYQIKARNGDLIETAWAGMGTATTQACPDTDGDGVPDNLDNCTLVPNPTQCDGDSDGYGNHCDSDFNNDLIVNGLDIGLFKAGFGTADPVTDLNCDGITNGLDVGLLKTMFGFPPGPSGIAP